MTGVEGTWGASSVCGPHGCRCATGSASAATALDVAENAALPCVGANAFDGCRCVARRWAVRWSDVRSARAGIASWTATRVRREGWDGADRDAALLARRGRLNAAWPDIRTAVDRLGEFDIFQSRYK